ncbi:hypothetical protein N0V84_001001 [Fusarium piperis]|uniref:Spindle pole body component n=1 Tax=Fusarium piperis TaxID=1435070 RepID=A0A9W8WM75_9HYPO|nr:hypothetical protein N0V84_001001 [Fusarium piperis]
MAEPDDLSAVFDVPDLWKGSKWHAQLNGNLDGPNPFFSPSLKNDLDSDFVQLSSIAVEKNGFFQLPSLQPEEAEPEITTSSNEISTPKESIHDAEPTDDLWMDMNEPDAKTAEHKTWDGFIAGTATVGQPHMVTEAGAGVYDALLTWSMDPLELKNSDIPIIDSKAYFTSLLALALGQESVFFFRSDKGRSLAPALPSMRVSGYSRDVLEGLEKQCHKCGLMFLELQSFVQTTYSKRTNRCGVALAGALDQVLKDVQQHVAVSGQNPRSLLELQSTVKGLLAILAPFRRLTSKFRKGYTDEHVLSYVFHEAYSVDYGEEQLRGIMREVLQRVSQPWIEFLEEWIGTKREEGLPLTKANVGESKGFIKVDKEKYMDDFGQEVEDVDFRLDENKMPHFMPYDIAKSIFETGKNLRFIRTCHPEHPLATPNILDVTRPPKIGWLYDWDAIHELEARVNEYRANLFDAVQRARTHQEPDQHEEQDLLKRYMLPLAAGAELQYHGIEANQMEQRLLASIEQFNQPLPDHGAEDSLSQVIRQRLSGAYRPPTQRPDFAPHWSLLPVLSFGGIASAQSHVVNQESLRLLFSRHDLRSHLKMHRDFHMFGNGLFVSRLSHALFDPELETAERQAGVARQGGVMGLRLGGRDTWPPASSELRLALMGVLAESFTSDNGFSKERLTSISRDSTELPGDLSFGVRDLSEEEIEKCMNPDSLEALDFLRLSYKAPGPLSSIITPVILTQYDRIFKFLLRILRMLYVINQLFRDVNSRTTHWYDPEDISYRFAREAHHFVSGITSFFFDSGIAIPWQAFEAKLDKIESDLNNPDLSSTPETVESPDRLREFHSRVLDRIMLSLFLRKRQQPVLKLLDEIFVSLLAYSKFSRTKAMGIGPDTGPEETREEIKRLYKNFKTKVQIFATVCRALTEKSRSTSNKVSDDLGLKQEGIGEDHMVAQLLMKLEMNNYYSKG